jgi:hypothetical protein
VRSPADLVLPPDAAHPAASATTAMSRPKSTNVETRFIVITLLVAAGSAWSAPYTVNIPYASLANTLTSPRPSFSAAVSRSLNFWILPDAVMGYSSTKNTYLGAL